MDTGVGTFFLPKKVLASPQVVGCSLSTDSSGCGIAYALTVGYPEEMISYKEGNCHRG